MRETPNQGLVDERPKVIGRCRTCKWFNDGDEPGIHDGHEMSAPCSSTALICWGDNPTGEQARVANDSWLEVGPLFGCVHWEVARRLENDND